MTTQESISISVIVLTYNQAQTISQTLDSILAQQTNYLYEIIIGEDASPDDNTREICEQYVAKYPDIIRLLPVSPNKGVVRNYMDCLSIARGTYIAGCAGDDWWHDPLKIQVQADYLESHPEYGVVHTDMDILYENTGKIVKAFPRLNIPEGQIHESLYGRFFINAPTVMYRRELLRYAEFEKYSQLGFLMEDYPMWLEFSHHTQFHYMDRSTVTYRFLQKSVSHSPDLCAILRLLDSTHQVQNYFFNKYRPQLPQPLLMSQGRMKYMACLQHKAYRRSFQYIKDLGLPWWIRLPLHTRLGGWLCGHYLSSSYYRHRKR